MPMCRSRAAVSSANWSSAKGRSISAVRPCACISTAITCRVSARVGRDAFLKKALALAHHNRVDKQVILINQIVLNQELDQFGAARDQEIFARLLLELPDLVRDIAFDEMRVRPLRFVQCR